METSEKFGADCVGRELYNMDIVGLIAWIKISK